MALENKVLSSILVKPAGPDCNLACEYCFYLKKADLFAQSRSHRMSDPVLREMVSQVMKQGGKQISFGWQGGEPTLMGLGFFKRAVEYQARFGSAGQVVGNGLQTNGVLIDGEWASFLRQAGFLVGLSLDGPAEIHNRYRRFPSGKPSWDRVVRARDLLLSAGVEVNALVVVNDYSVRFPSDIYNDHKRHGLSYMQFIPCVELDPRTPGRAAPFSVSAEAFGRFLCEVFDLWRADFVDGRPGTSVRWFDSLFYTYVGRPAPECTLLQECGIYVVVEHNGDVYACDFFVDPEWRLGNIKDSRIVDMLNSKRQGEFGAIKRNRPPECAECPWLRHCWGGCPKDRAGDPRDRGSNHFCLSYKMFFEHADAEFRRMAQEWKNRQRSGNGSQPVRDEDPCPCGSGRCYADCCKG